MVAVRTDPRAIVESTSGRAVRFNRAHEDIRLEYERQLTYDVDAVATAQAFRDAGATWMHVVDLDGAKEGRPINLAIIENIIKHTKLQVEVGGGIRTEESMEYVLAIGATRLILGTRALADMDWFQAMTQDARFRNRLVHFYQEVTSEELYSVLVGADLDDLEGLARELRQASVRFQGEA